MPSPSSLSLEFQASTDHLQSTCTWFYILYLKLSIGVRRAEEPVGVSQFTSVGVSQLRTDTRVQMRVKNTVLQLASCRDSHDGTPVPSSMRQRETQRQTHTERKCRRGVGSGLVLAPRWALGPDRVGTGRAWSKRS